MKFNGTIITDPCYITDKFDYINNTMDSHEFTHYLMRNTIYGDWSCTTFRTNEDPKEMIDKVMKAEASGKDDDIDLYRIGEFTADAGMVGVYLLEEVLKVNPKFSDFIKDKPYCVTVIDDFNGDVDIIVDDNFDTVHVVGVSNNGDNFYTLQTGL